MRLTPIIRRRVHAEGEGGELAHGAADEHADRVLDEIGVGVRLRPRAEQAPEGEDCARGPNEYGEYSES